MAVVLVVAMAAVLVVAMALELVKVWVPELELGLDLGEGSVVVKELELVEMREWVPAERPVVDLAN